MRELVVISGKGGTGKTSLTAAFAHLAGMNEGGPTGRSTPSVSPLVLPHGTSGPSPATPSKGMVLCDLDVDAPDLHLLAAPEIHRSGPFLSGHLAEIDPEACTGCGCCEEVCAFGAIRKVDGTFRVEPSACEGCKVCVALCPVQAIAFPERLCGTWYESGTRFGPMVHALLDPGQENSGKLVTLLKAKAREVAAAEGLDLILSDGAPGIGCPVISSLSQATLALLVTEPTPSGLHDLKRVADLCRHFRIPTAVLINKADLSAEYESAIRDFCREGQISVVGSLPHDPGITWAMVRGRAVTEEADPDEEGHPATTASPLVLAIREAWARVQALLDPPSSSPKELQL